MIREEGEYYYFIYYLIIVIIKELTVARGENKLLQYLLKCIFKSEPATAYKPGEIYASWVPIPTVNLIPFFSIQYQPNRL